MKILFIDTVHPFLKKTLEEKKYICDIAYKKNKEEIEKIIKKYEGIVIRSKFSIDKKFIDKAKKLKFIARAGVGTENIDIKYLKKKRIKCFNSGNANSQSVAEHALGMLLMLLNNINKTNNEVRKGIWKREANRGVELSGKTIAIIGFGNTGSRLAKLLKPFEVKILAYDKYLSKYPYQSTMRQIYNQANIISLHIPLTKETTFLVNDLFIKKFKKPIYIINTARGKCVCTKSLVNGMKTKKILGACLDVLENEKESFTELSKEKGLDQNIKSLVKSTNVILSPHIAGWTQESNYKIAKVLFEKITKNYALL